MPRIPESEIERLKSEVSLLDWVRGEGLDARKRGKDYVLLCPFHEEDSPSCVITPSKNLWNCFGCGEGGTIVDWVMKRRGVSFPHAIEILRTGSNAPVPENNYKAQHIEPLMPMDVSGQVALGEVVDYYHQCLLDSSEALAYLEKRGLGSHELIKAFKLGYCNRTLGYRLPSKHTKAGKTIRATLKSAGIYRETMFEHFGGCLVVPILGDQGEVLEIYGRKIRPDHKIGKNEMKHGYLPGAHRGVWNDQIFKACDEIILCESLIDAMTFWVNGFRNVTSIYGTSGFSGDLKAAFENWADQTIRQGNLVGSKINPAETQSGMDKLSVKQKRVFLAFDRDEAGDKATEKYADWFAARGIEVRRVLFPKGMDANDYALKVQPAGKALDHLLRSAELIGAACDEGDEAVHCSEGEGVAQDKQDVPRPQNAKPVLHLAADKVKQVQSSLVVEREEGQLHMTIGDRVYRVRGLEKNLSYGALKVNLMVRSPANPAKVGTGFASRFAPNQGGDVFHVDSLDLYQARQRSSFIHQGSLELGQSEEVIKRDLGLILLKLEELQGEQIKKALEVKPLEDQMDADQKAKALAFLKSPDLIEKIVSDFGRLGVVGEDINVLTGYLAATSRKLEKPLAVIIQSSSAAGKSSLMEAVLALMPEDERVQYSALTGQSLFYMGETNLKNKILAIAEEEGASNASYALKLLQSEGVITIASTGKDDATGQLVTKEYRVEGPVMLFLTTTAIDIDEELLNRCMVLTVNETRAQTQAIHALQRQRQTLEGLLADMDRSEILSLHRRAQTLLRPLKVVNPYAGELSFADGQTRTRRDHMKYLGLISSIALLHQYGREVKRVEHKARVIEYVEVIPSDIALANKLAGVVLGRTLDELPPQTRKLLMQLQDWVGERAEALEVLPQSLRFRRKDVRAEIGWTDTMLKIHLGRLVEMEYLTLHRATGRGGMIFEYELAYDGASPSEMGLKLPKALSERAGSEPPEIVSTSKGSSAKVDTVLRLDEPLNQKAVKAVTN